VESLERGCRVSYSGCEDANAGNLRRLLRARRERPCRGAADEGDELAAVHSITSSARNSSAGEIVISSVSRRVTQSKIYLRASLARLVELFDECRERRRDGRRERVILVP